MSLLLVLVWALKISLVRLFSAHLARRSSPRDLTSTVRLGWAGLELELMAGKGKDGRKKKHQSS